MSQYTDGKIIIDTNDSSIITGVGTLFLSNVYPGNLFIIDGGEATVHIIKKVISDTQIQLDTVCNEAALGIELGYCITKMFSSVFGLPMCKSDYKSFPQLMTLSLRELDCIFKNLKFINPKDPKCIIP